MAFVTAWLELAAAQRTVSSTRSRVPSKRSLAERFRFSPQAAITYFGILVSSCKVLVEVPDCRVMVVDDHEFGTNDCRGWISQSLFRKLQQKHQSELLARETERLHAQRIAERSEEQQELPLTEDRRNGAGRTGEAQDSRQANRGASLLSISSGVRQDPGEGRIQGHGG